MSDVGTFSWTDVTRHGAVSSIVRAGVDRVELDEFQRTMDVAGQPFLDRIFTEAEIMFCAGRVERLATRFAAKEAVAKVLGTGFRDLNWLEIEVVSSSSGQPHIHLHHRARDHANELAITSIAVSLTHTTKAAEAFVVALCAESRSTQSLREETHHG